MVEEVAEGGETVGGAEAAASASFDGGLIGVRDGSVRGLGCGGDGSATGFTGMGLGSAAGSGTAGTEGEEGDIGETKKAAIADSSG
jgi:hypothetical protein